MKKLFNEGNQLHNFMSSSGSGTVINYGSGSDFLTSNSYGSTSQKVTVPTVPVPVPQHCIKRQSNIIFATVIAKFDNKYKRLGRTAMLWSRNQNNRNRNFLPWWNRNRI
jgi:hypothetical protein